MNQGVK